MLVGWWLGLVRLLATPLVRARVPPNAVTALAVAAAAGAAVVAPALPVVAAGLVLVNGLLDGLDGAVAVLSRRVTRLGFLLDSLADRVSDVLLLVALWRAGAPGLACVAAGVALGLLEYARARAGQAGMRGIGVVTVGERPVRVVLGAAGLAVPASVVSGAVAGVTAALAGIGLVQFFVVAVRRLTSPRD